MRQVSILCRSRHVVGDLLLLWVRRSCSRAGCSRCGSGAVRSTAVPPCHTQRSACTQILGWCAHWWRQSGRPPVSWRAWCDCSGALHHHQPTSGGVSSEACLASSHRTQADPSDSSVSCTTCNNLACTVRPNTTCVHNDPRPAEQTATEDNWQALRPAAAPSGIDAAPPDSYQTVRVMHRLEELFLAVFVIVPPGDPGLLWAKKYCCMLWMSTLYEGDSHSVIPLVSIYRTIEWI